MESRVTRDGYEVLFVIITFVFVGKRLTISVINLAITHGDIYSSVLKSIFKHVVCASFIVTLYRILKL